MTHHREPSTGSGVCVNRGLTEDIRLAMNTLVELNKREMDAMIAGNFAALGLNRAELVETRERVDSPLKALRDHFRKHELLRAGPV